MPVTDHEVVMQEGQTIVSKTNLKGAITYVNRDFIEISGFSEAELIGKNHNIVRHPDMPPEAFADLWNTMKQGKPWTGIVKNRCKNGDYYWVRADVAPVYESGKLVEYISVRSKPSADHIKTASNFYEQLKGNPQLLHEGIPVSAFQRFKRTKLGKIKVGQKFGLIGVGVLALALLLLASGLGKVQTMNTLETMHAITAADPSMAQLNTLLEAELSGSMFSVYGSSILSVLIILMLGVGMFFTARSIVAGLKQATQNAQRICEGDYKSDYVINSDDEIGQMLCAIKAMQIAQGFAVEDTRRVAEESLRIKNALDACSTNVMLADNNLNIIYMNNSVQKMFEDAQEDLREEISGFDARNLLGTNADMFHKNPQHQRDMVEALKQPYSTQISVGSRTFKLIATPVFTEDGSRIGTAIEWNDRTEELARIKVEERLAAENARIKQALDNVSANVMVADANRDIIYMNPAVVKTLQNAEQDIQQELPNFNVSRLLGSSIDQFHKNPRHQRDMLAGLTSTHATKIVVGGRHMALTVSPVTDEKGERLGTAVEWDDQTAQVKIQEELDALITAANCGDLDQRIRLEGKDGFFRSLSEGLNVLLDVTSGFVDDVGAVFESMADGDLTKNVERQYQGKFDQIKSNANESMGKLREVLLGIQNASNTVRTAATEVSQGSDDLSRRTEAQASSLEETAASMEEINSTVRQSSENANESNGLADSARKKAEAGGDVVQSAVSAMKEILDASNKINDIIGVIDEIAFQTNLLALNAAVEAARAGEQGRGFAVVAGEVRTLSQRSASAAKEIKDLIRDSVVKVESGSQLVNQSGETLADIMQAVEEVAGKIREVANAAVEQTAGISQINQAISQMDSMTQQNAALVEETTAASRSMSEEAAQMNQMISFFKLN